jgi:hypothetical protein
VAASDDQSWFKISGKVGRINRKYLYKGIKYRSILMEGLETNKSVGVKIGAKDGNICRKLARMRANFRV